MAPQITTYKADSVAVTLNGVLLDGFAEDEFIKFTWQAPRVEYMAGIGGAAVRSISSNKICEVEITFVHGSKGGFQCDALARLDELTGKGLVPFTFFDPSSGDSFGAVGISVSKLPDVAYGGKPGNKTFTLTTHHMERTLETLSPFRV